MKKIFAFVIPFVFLVLVCHQASAQSEPLRVAVITGNHPFDLPNLYKMFRELKGVDAYPQHLDNFTSSSEEIRDSYAVVVFYNMHGSAAPVDEGSPWWMGKPNAALQRLFDRGQGIVVVHHALLAWKEWDVWSDAVGFSDRGFKYKPNIDIEIKVADKNHPITQNQKEFKIVDEGYVLNGKYDGKGKVLLTTQHENAMKEVAWVREFKNSRVFCLALGHDNLAWSNPGFQDVLTNGVKWTAGK